MTRLLCVKLFFVSFFCIPHVLAVFLCVFLSYTLKEVFFCGLLVVDIPAHRIVDLPPGQLKPLAAFSGYERDHQ